MNIKTLAVAAGVLASSQAFAFGDFLGSVLQNAAQQAVGNAVQQAATPQPAQPAYGAGVPAGTPYGVGGCVQNVPAGPPGVYADVDRNGCVDHTEYANYTTYLAQNYPQYLNGMTSPAAGYAVPGQPAVNPYAAAAQYGANGNQNAAAAAAAAAALAGQQQAPGNAGNAQAVGTAVQGLMGLFGR